MAIEKEIKQVKLFIPDGNVVILKPSDKEDIFKSMDGRHIVLH